MILEKTCPKDDFFQDLVIKSKQLALLNLPVAFAVGDINNKEFLLETQG